MSEPVSDAPARTGTGNDPATVPTDPGAPTPGTAPPAGRATPPVCPGYDVLDVLGRGARSVVYRVRQKETGRVLALKVFRPGDQDDPEASRRFAANTAAHARLQSLPDVMGHLEVGEFNGQPYFVVECAEGGSLA